MDGRGATFDKLMLIKKGEQRLFDVLRKGGVLDEEGFRKHHVNEAKFCRDFCASELFASSIALLLSFYHTIIELPKEPTDSPEFKINHRALEEDLNKALAVSRVTNQLSDKERIQLVYRLVDILDKINTLDKLKKCPVKLEEKPQQHKWQFWCCRNTSVHDHPYQLLIETPDKIKKPRVKPDEEKHSQPLLRQQRTFS